MLSGTLGSMLLAALLAVILHNATFGDEKCMGESYGLGMPLPIDPIHKWGETEIRIDTVLHNKNVVGFILIDADGRKVYQPRSPGKPPYIIDQELRVFQASMTGPFTPTFTQADLRETLVNGPIPIIPFLRFPDKSFTNAPCLIADLRGHT